MKKRLLILCLLFISISSCSTLKYKKKGFVTQTNYIQEIPFEYTSGLIFIPITIENKNYTFLFDTGCELNIISPNIEDQINLKPLKKGTISNDKDSAKGVSSVEINSITIGDINFQETAGMIWDLSKLSELIGCVQIDGIIGNNLMRKASWQIDYKNKVIRVSDNIEKFNISKDSKKITMNSGNVGNVLLDLTIRNKTKKFTFDTGYNGFIQTGNSDFIDESMSLVRVGLTGANFKGQQQGKTYFGDLKSFSVNGIDFKSPSTILMKPNNGSVLGNEFYEHFVMTIDWENDQLYLDPIEDIEFDNSTLFEVGLYANYATNEILISGVFEGSILLDIIKPHSKVLKINDLDVSNLEDLDLCTFWHAKWLELNTSDQLNLTIETDNEVEDFVIHKMTNKW